MHIGNLLPGRRLTVKLGILLRLEVVDKSFALLLSSAFVPHAVNRSALLDADSKDLDG